MAIQKREKEINGRVYGILLPSPIEAMPICNRTVVLMGGFLGLIGELKDAGDEEVPREKRLGTILEKFSGALTQVDPVATYKLMMDSAFAAHLSVSGTESLSSEIQFNRHFEDKRSEIYPVLLWCLWECVSDFFPQLGAFAQTIKGAATEAVSQSQTAGQTTTG
jgi:hypothetical protein